MARISQLSYLALVCFLFIFAKSAYAQSVHGVFRVVKGDVKVTQSSDGKEVKAKIGQKVFPKDVIFAGKDSRAKIVMIDNNEINVSPDSKVQIQNYEYKPNEEKKNVLINVLYGKVRAKVNQKYEGENSFQVKTPSAVAGVRGTDFFTSYDRSNNSTKVVTFEGKVAFGLPGPGGQIMNPVYVSVGQTTSVVGSQPPAPPVEMPKTELSQMEQQTDAEKAPDAPAREAASEPAPPKEEKKDEKKDGPKAPPPGPNARPAGGGENRQPNAVAGPVPGGSMLMPGDLASAPNPIVPPIMPTLGGLPLGPAPIPNMVLPPTNDFIREVIGSSRKKIIINVTTPGP